MLLRLYIQIFFTVRLQKAFSYKVLKLLLRLKLFLLSYQKLIEYSRIQNIDYSRAIKHFKDEALRLQEQQEPPPFGEPPLKKAQAIILLYFNQIIWV